VILNASSFFMPLNNTMAISGALQQASACAPLLCTKK
jgi:hypothetical protein